MKQYFYSILICIILIATPTYAVNDPERVQQFKEQNRELVARMERAMALCLDPARFDLENTVVGDYKGFYSESIIGGAITRPATRLWRWSSEKTHQIIDRIYGWSSYLGYPSFPDLSPGEIAERSLISMLRQTRKELHLRRSQAVCLAACVARVMVKVDYWINFKSLFAKTPRVLEQSTGMCTEVVEVTRTLAEGLGISIRESSIDPIYGLNAPSLQWKIINTVLFPMIVSGAYHKLTQVRLEDGRDYYFDPLWEYKVPTGQCYFNPGDSGLQEQNTRYSLNDRMKKWVDRFKNARDSFFAEIEPLPEQWPDRGIEENNMEFAVFFRTLFNLSSGVKIYRLPPEVLGQTVKSESEMDMGFAKLDKDGSVVLAALVRRKGHFMLYARILAPQANRFSKLIEKKVPAMLGGILQLGTTRVSIDRLSDLVEAISDIRYLTRSGSRDFKQDFMIDEYLVFGR